MEEEDEKISKSIIGRNGSTQSDSMRAGRRNNRKFCGYNGKGAETIGNT